MEEGVSRTAFERVPRRLRLRGVLAIWGVNKENLSAAVFFSLHPQPIKLFIRFDAQILVQLCIKAQGVMLDTSEPILRPTLDAIVTPVDRGCLPAL